MSIGDICNREVIIAYKQENLEKAVRLMREYHVGDVIVVEERDGGRVPVGILTDRDILISVIGEDIEPRDISIEDVMSFELLTGHVDDSLLESLARMRQKGVRRLPVVDGRGELVGILTMDDIIDVLAEEIADLAGLIRNEQKREIGRAVDTGAPAD